MNDKTKAYMMKVKKELVEALEKAFPNLPIYEDEVPDDETQKYDHNPYHLLVYSMGDFTKGENTSNSLTQSITIIYYSENRDDFDETIIDILGVAVNVKSITFSDCTKARARHADTNRFVDIANIELNRVVKLEYQI
ncbi:hypothetical protein SFC08_08925 [Lysinibacillus halotolerans]|uniref:DUF3168 domain-containing protein n=1 Tax=Lysinibacillus halotolerans TaxID=1368476 RepID=A0A3M8H604_9BACI|nr:hypothetical protein [Lysinibacillus halotolerans]RNC97845.1 hypothetical protein EC501_13570 [Lysinibacillus halotolerans]